MKAIGWLHARMVSPRRVRVLAAHLVKLLPTKASVLDVGCGDGALAESVTAARSDLKLIGIDVLVRRQSRVPVIAFDGYSMPFDDNAFDVALFVDVLHHVDSPARLLAEARRVVRRSIVIKDHLSDGVLADPTLRLMDWLGNRAHGVRLPYNYWSRGRWMQEFEAQSLAVEKWIDRLGLYPAPVSLLCDRSLHFIASLHA